MQLGRRDRSIDSPPHEEVANIGVGLEQYGRWKEHIVDANDALFVELDVVDEWRAAVKGEVQSVVKIVVEVGARADEEVNEPALHQLDHTSAKTRGRQCTGDGQRDGRVVLGQQHLVREDTAGLAKPRRIERLKTLVDQVPDVGAAARPIVANGFAREVVWRVISQRPGHGEASLG